jgi:hypothetical protein
LHLSSIHGITSASRVSFIIIITTTTTQIPQFTAVSRFSKQYRLSDQSLLIYCCAKYKLFIIIIIIISLSVLTYTARHKPPAVCSYERYQRLKSSLTQCKLHARYSAWGPK